MSPKDRLTAFGEQVGFSVRTESGFIEAVGVPCLLANGLRGSCTIRTSYDPASGKPTKETGNAVHAVEIITSAEHDGLVYQANGSAIGNHLDGDNKTWSIISVKRGSQGEPLDDESASDLIHRYAKQIVGAVLASGHSDTAFSPRPNPFNILNTFEARAAIGPVQDRIRNQRIAIIGLGGTGAYVLDLVAKTPVPRNPSHRLRRC